MCSPGSSERRSSAIADALIVVFFGVVLALLGGILGALYIAWVVQTFL